MIEIPLLEDMTWYGACRCFPTGPEAKDAWASLGDLDPSGSWDVGIYRHQRIGLDSEPVLVSVVGDKKEGVEAAERALGEGVETELHHDTWLVLIKRRMEVVIKLRDQGAESGRHLIIHPPEGDRLA